MKYKINEKYRETKSHGERKLKPWVKLKKSAVSNTSSKGAWG